MSNASILIVEDDVVVSMDIQGLLEDTGYRVCGVASSAEEAWELARKQCPDLVLMDISLRGSPNGIEAARQLRLEHDLPTIFLTAYADRDTIEKAKEAEPYGYLVKPFEVLGLRATIEMALTRVRLEKEKARLIEELQEVLTKVKLLSGPLPICGHCRKIRNEEGRWEFLEEYIQKSSAAQFTQGICPDCTRRHCPDVHSGCSADEDGKS